jgi:hypothetical protein
MFIGQIVLIVGGLWVVFVVGCNLIDRAVERWAMAGSGASLPSAAKSQADLDTQKSDNANGDDDGDADGDANGVYPDKDGYRAPALGDDSGEVGVGGRGVYSTSQDDDTDDDMVAGSWVPGMDLFAGLE